MTYHRNHHDEINAMRARMLAEREAERLETIANYRKDLASVTNFDRAIRSAPIRPDGTEGGGAVWIVAFALLVLLIVGCLAAPALTAEILGVNP